MGTSGKGLVSKPSDPANRAGRMTILIQVTSLDDNVKLGRADLLKEKMGCSQCEGLSSEVINSFSVGGQGLEELTSQLDPKECVASSSDLGREDKEI